MAAKTDIRFNLSGMDEFARQAKSMRARVGIIGTDAAQLETIKENYAIKGRKFNEAKFRGESQPLTNAELGAIQIFGSVTKKIPPRDFLVFPLQYNRKKIIRDMQTSKVKEALKRRDWKLVFGLLGAIAEGYVQQAFETKGFGQWQPNKPSTVDRKGSAQPLIDTGQLRRAITSDVQKKGAI